MSLESELFTLLKTTCPRVFPDFAPVSTAKPYVTYQGIGGQSINYVDNTVPDLENSRVQIDVWADTRLSAKAIIRQIEDTLRVATTIQARPESAPHNDYNADSLIYSSTQDFSIWASR